MPMRGTLSLLLVALLLVTGVLPRHRCTPAGSDGGVTVFVGAHAHEGPCDHEGGHGNPCEDGDDGRDGAPCCTHDAGDPTAPPTRGDFDPAAPTPVTAGVVVSDEVARTAAPAPTWHVPIPRPPTKTVVLLR
jgi:hypothetical protein